MARRDPETRQRHGKAGYQTRNALRDPGGPDGKLRAAVRDLIPDLIEFLDHVDGDADVEPSLANSDPEGSGDIWGDDREAEDEHDEIDDPGEDDGTAEPSLGAIERHPSVYSEGRTSSGHQLAWTDGNRTDLEDEHDGAEPDEDGEPTLGWTGGETIFGNYAGTFGVDNEMDDYAGRVEYLDRRRAQSPIHNRPGFWRWPNDNGPDAA